jgi:hypothetical protein
LLILLIPLLRGVERITGNDEPDDFEDLDDLEVDQA